MRFLAAKVELCSGCTRCEMACSLERTGAYSHSGSVVKVARVEELGVDLPVTCEGCLRCVEGCPHGALVVSARGTIELDEETCDGCGTCRDGCPFGVLDFSESPRFCTLCGRCVEACELGALAISEAGSPAPPPSRPDLDGLDPAQRRYLRALDRAVELPWIDEDHVRIYRQGVEGRPR